MIAERHGTVTGYSTDKCRCVPCKAAWAEYHRRRRTPENNRRANLRQKFGLELEDYSRMLLDQGGVCAACGQEETGTNAYGVVSLAVDHDHATGEVRGLLCMRCNRSLGMLGDNPETVERLLHYIRRHKQ